jgi:hypothetical protein
VRLTGSGAALFLIFLLAGLALTAQEEPPLDWDFDTLFDDPPQSGGPEGTPNAAPGTGSGAATGSGTAGGTDSEGAGEGDQEDSGSLLASLVRRSGFSLDFSYSANGGFAPGWDESPWFASEHEPEYSHVIGVNLYSYLGMDVQISDIFRVHSSLSFSVPGTSAINLGELFLDYNMFDRVFFRVGKFGQGWGISRNFGAANLLSRVPNGKGGESYIFKADIPIGIGGLQLLALTRSGFMKGSTPEFDELGYGGKYNLAFTWADIDMGVFYHQEMPLRGSVSAKTTIKDTELYFEMMGAVQHGTWDGFSFSANLGVAQSFADDLFSVNGEIFWNGEDNAFYFVPKTELKDAETSPFIPGLNLALNLVFRPGWIGNLRFALGSRWAAGGPTYANTAYIIPGLSFSPLRHIDVSLGFPLALGGREGRYYRSNADRNGRPVGIALLINLHGSYHLEKH